MTAEAWTIIGTGIAILVAIAASNHSIRTELRELRTALDRLEDRINRLEVTILERLAKLEGAFDVMRESRLDRHHVA